MHWLQLTLKCCFLWTDRWDPASSEPCQWDLFSMEVGAGLFSFLIRNETYSKHCLQSHGLACSIYSAEQRPGWESSGARNRHWAVITLARWAAQVSAAGAAKQSRVPWNTKTKLWGFPPVHEGVTSNAAHKPSVSTSSGLLVSWQTFGGGFAKSQAFGSIFPLLI